MLRCIPRHQPAFLIKIILATILATACKAKGPTPLESESTTKGLFSPEFIWPGATAVVCFADRKNNSADEFREIAAIVDFEINQRTPFRFTGFRLCSETPNATLEVRLPPKGRSNATVGQEKRDWFMDLFLSHFGLKGANRSSMELYQRDSMGLRHAPPLRHNIVLHEFGHAMGLQHEHLRNENRDRKFCDQNDDEMGIEPKGSVKVGSFDQNSIMNYCVENYSNKKLSLSSGDVATIRQMYSMSAAGANRGPIARCEKDALESCAKGNGGKTCVIKHCRGGDFVCEKPESLAKCLTSSGGGACLDKDHGSCTTVDD
jgi:hypothetical protein